ncbi:MAG: hypothetical protein WB992_14535 [Bryobacteraceae bacterium]
MNPPPEYSDDRYSSMPNPIETLGETPSYFDEELKTLWVEVASLSAPGILTELDRILVGTACCLLSSLRIKGLHESASALLKRRLSEILKEMLLGPVEIAKLMVPERTAETDAAALLNYTQPSNRLS